MVSVNNMGPGLRRLGPAGNFEWMSEYQTCVCAAGMLLGRLEMLSVPV